MSEPSGKEQILASQVADLKRQLAAERDGRMRAEALLDDARRSNNSLRAELAARPALLDGEACPRCRLVL